MLGMMQRAKACLEKNVSVEVARGGVDPSHALPKLAKMQQRADAHVMQRQVHVVQRMIRLGAFVGMLTVEGGPFTDLRAYQTENLLHWNDVGRFDNFADDEAERVAAMLQAADED